MAGPAIEFQHVQHAWPKQHHVITQQKENDSHGNEEP